MAWKVDISQSQPEEAVLTAASAIDRCDVQQKD